MTCRQPGGACDEAFSADSFEEIAGMSKKHGMKMFENRDEAHLAAMAKMQAMMETPGEMEAWFESRRKALDALPND